MSYPTVTVYLLAGPTHSSLSDKTQIGDALATDIQPDGAFTYSIPVGTPADNYRIRITSDGLTSDSDGFNLYSDTAVENVHTFEKRENDLDIKIHDNILRFPMGVNSPSGWYGYIDRKFPTYLDTDGSTYTAHIFKGYYFDDRNIPRLPNGFVYGELTDASSNDSIITNTNTYRYKVTVVYDNKQESALSEGGVSYLSPGNAKNTVTVKWAYDLENYNPRITAFCVYRALNPVDDDKLNTYKKVGTVDMLDPDIGIPTDIEIKTNNVFKLQAYDGAGINASAGYLESTDTSATRKGAVGFMLSPYSESVIAEGDSRVGHYGDTYDEDGYQPMTAGGDIRFIQKGYDCDEYAFKSEISGLPGTDIDANSQAEVDAKSWLNSGPDTKANISSYGDHHYVDFSKCVPYLHGHGLGHNVQRDKYNFFLCQRGMYMEYYLNDVYNTRYAGAWPKPISIKKPEGDDHDLNSYHQTLADKNKMYTVTDIPDQNASASGGIAYSHFEVDRDAPPAGTDNTYYLIDNFNLIKWGQPLLTGGYRSGASSTENLTSLHNITSYLDEASQTDESTSTAQGWWTSGGHDSYSYCEARPGSLMLQRNGYHRMDWNNMYVRQRHLPYENGQKYIYTATIVHQQSYGGNADFRIKIWDDDASYVNFSRSAEEGLAQCVKGTFTANTSPNKNLSFEIAFDQGGNGGTSNKRFFVTQMGIFKILSGLGVQNDDIDQGTIDYGGKGFMAIDNRNSTVDYDAPTDNDLVGRSISHNGAVYYISGNKANVINCDNEELVSTNDTLESAVLRPRASFTKQSDGKVEAEWIDGGIHLGAEHYLGHTNLNTYYKYSQFIDGRNYVGNVKIFANDTKSEVHKNWVMFSELGKPDIIPATNFIQLDDLQGGEIVGLERLYSDLCILMSKGIYRLSLNQIDPTRWSLKETEANLGCLSEDSILTYEGKIFFAGHEAFYMLDTNFNAIPLTNAINTDYQNYKSYQGVSDIKTTVDVLRQELHMRLPGLKYHSYILDLKNLTTPKWRVHQYSSSEETETFVTDENYELFIVRHKVTKNYTDYSFLIDDESNIPTISNGIDTYTASTISQSSSGSTGYIVLEGVDKTTAWSSKTHITLEGSTSNDGNYDILEIATVNADTYIRVQGALDAESAGSSQTVIVSGPYEINFPNNDNPVPVALPYTPSYLNIENNQGENVSYVSQKITSSTSNKITLEGTGNKPPNEASDGTKLTTTGSVPITLNFKVFDGDSSDPNDDNDTVLYQLEPTSSTEPVKLVKKTGFITLTNDVTRGKTIRRIYVHHTSSEDWDLSITFRVAVGTNISEYSETEGVSKLINITHGNGFKKQDIIRPKIANIRCFQVTVSAPSSINKFEVNKLVIETD